MDLRLMSSFERLIAVRRYTRFRSGLLLGADLFIVASSLMASCLLDITAPYEAARDSRFEQCVWFSAIMVLTYGVVFLFFGIHRSLWMFISARELVSLCLAVGVGAAIGAAVMLLRPIPHIAPLRFTLLSASMIVIGMAALRIAYRAYRERIQLRTDTHARQRALIVGADEPGYVLLKEVQRNPHMHADVIGFIDTNRIGHIVSGVRVLGGLKDIMSLIKKHDIGLVYIASSALTHGQKTRLIKQLSTQGIQMKVMRFGEEQGTAAHRIEDVSVEDLLGRGQVKLDQKEVASYLSGKHILVTGAGGSIGSQLVREIMPFAPHTLYLLDINENSLYLLDRELDFMKQDERYAAVTTIPLITNIREADALDKLFRQHHIDVVFHAAAHKHVPLMEIRPQEAVKNNVFGTKNVLDCAIRHGVDRFILVSTDKAVNPTNVMGASKRVTEMIMQSLAETSKTRLAAVRFGNVLGSNGSVIPIFKVQIKKGGPVTLTDKRATRYFMTIPEAAQLVLQAGYYAKHGDILTLLPYKSH